MISLEEKLKNPVWYSLLETHQQHQINYNDVLFYDPNICSFGAFEIEQKTNEALNSYADLIYEFFLVTENSRPTYDEKHIKLKKKINGCQMVLDRLTTINITEEIIQLNINHIDQVYELIWKVMPGYYQKNGFTMGDFFGIFKEGKLIAISGQRMQGDDFVEISSVVTHPKYTKRGFAKQLIYATTQAILQQNKLPILHTNKGNLAIPLYEKLGFSLTRDMNWWMFEKL